MSKQTTKPSDGLVPWTYGGHRFLLSPEGEVWREDGGKPSGDPLASLSLKQAQAWAKRDPSLRRATLDHTRPREDGRPGLRKEPPLPLVFEEAGIRQVRFVCGMPKGSAGRVVPDPILLHGDETTRWVLVSSDRDGLLVFHAPSVAYQQVTHGRNG